MKPLTQTQVKMSEMKMPEMKMPEMKLPTPTKKMKEMPDSVKMSRKSLRSFVVRLALSCCTQVCPHVESR